MRRSLPSVLAVVLCSLVAGCTDMPTDGPIVEVTSTADVADPQPLEFEPLPPEDDATQTQIVAGFLDAMTAWPRRLDVAQQYLTADARAAWRPEPTITYDDLGPLNEDGLEVTAEFTEPQRIDHRGSWLGPDPANESYTFDLVVEDGQYRVDNPPQALMVPRDWYADRYRRADLFFLDRTERILVPEPVFVPRGEQLATTLVDRLLVGPLDARVEKSAFDPRLSVDFSVPLDDGIAEIALEGAALPRSPQLVERMVAQLAWTLEQEGIESFRLTISGDPVHLPGGETEFDVNSAPEYDPTGYQASQTLFGLHKGVLVGGDQDGLTKVDGPFGRPLGVRAATVSIDGDQVAGVTDDGGTVLVGPVEPDQERAGVRAVLSGADGLLEPAWDFSGRLWLVDRADGAARVWYVDRGRARQVRVPQVTGTSVRSFLVSRDGTRLVAVVREGSDDVLRVSRLQTQATSVRAIRSHRIVLEPGEGTGRRIQDIAWTAPTTIAVLETVLRDERYDVERIAVDGAPVEITSTTLSAPVLHLAGSPVEGSRQYAVTRRALIELTSQQQFEPGVWASLDYVG